MKKLLFVAMFIAILGAIMVMKPAQADTFDIIEEGTCGPNAKYKVDSNKVATIYGSGVIEDFNTRKYSVKKIIIENGITEIKKEALAYHTRTEEFYISSSVKKIGDWAFRSCFKLKKITLEEGIEEIGEEAFFEDKSLEKVALPDSVKRMGHYVFKNCDNLTEVKLPQSINVLRHGPFESCKNLKKVVMPEKYKKIGALTFRLCNSIKCIKISDSTEELDKLFARSCKNLKTIVIGKGVKKAHKDCLDGSLRLKKVVNNSSISIPLPTAKGKKIWTVGKKKVTKVPAGKTAIMKGKKYRISYTLHGGKLVSPMPKYHRYARDTKLPKVKMKGYSFFGWEAEGTNKGISTSNTLNAGIYGKVKAEALLRKLKISVVNRRIKISVKSSNYGKKGYKRKDDCFYYRYADNKEMKKIDRVVYTYPYQKGRTPKLKPGTYYVQLAFARDCVFYEFPDYMRPYGGWIFTKKVVVK